MVIARRLLLLLACLAAADAWAAVAARTDRAEVDLNESFTLEIVSDGDPDEQPDVSVLEQDFYIGRGSELMNTTIVNGRIERSKTWSFVLMPKRAGQLTIPPIRVGMEQSDPLLVIVSEPSYAPPGEADVFVTSEVDLDETYVQAQVLLTIKIYRAVATRQPALREPDFSGVEHLRELAGDDRSYEAVIDGRTYSVVERVYAVYPQESGTLEISPARFEARVLRDGRITGRKVYESEPQTVIVRPIPPPPAHDPAATWLPAREVMIAESWSRDPAEIRAGEPLTRHVTISALGQLETQIPALEPPSAPGINVYPDKPELSRRVEPRGIRGVRRDQYAVIGTEAGTVALPALEVPWWDIEAGEWRVADLPGRTITVLPSEQLAPPVEPAEAPVAASAEEAPPTPAGDGIWRRATELLGALWVVTMLAWWWTSRPDDRRPREPEPPPIHRQQSRLLKAARKASRAGDGAGVRQALLDWGALQWPGNAPRSIGALAGRVSAPLADELRRLSTAAYGPGPAEWDGEALARALRSFAVIEDDTGPAEDPLPPLMP